MRMLKGADRERWQARNERENADHGEAIWFKSTVPSTTGSKVAAPVLCSW